VSDSPLEDPIAEAGRAAEAADRAKLRAAVGDRKRWYDLPEEVRSPYQPE
jgi:hypothetical protein